MGDNGYINERLHVRVGEDLTESNQNGTLANTSGDMDGVDYTIATHVEVPLEINTPQLLADYLAALFAPITEQNLIHVEVDIDLPAN